MNFLIGSLAIFFGVLAQWVERNPVKITVVGSNPAHSDRQTHGLWTRKMCAGDGSPEFMLVLERKHVIEQVF